jgi:hypothetical protein
MTLDCRKVQKSLESFHAAGLPGDMADAVETHLTHCADCRSAAFQHGLTRLLKTAALAPQPEPGMFFMTRLSGALADCPAPLSPLTMADLLARASLRFVPAITALVMLISIGSAYLTAPAEEPSATASAEELLLDDHPLSADLMMAAITGEPIER